MTTDTRILGIPLRVVPVTSGSTSADALPESIGGYSVIRAVGQGGMGAVLEVRHNALGKRFALKLLSDTLRENAEAVERFRSETLALGKLEHPNIVQAIDAGVWQGRPYLVTELLKGQDLATRVSQLGKLDDESVISIASQLADALSLAHEQGYFHRDIKPSNIFFQSDGKAKLLDFGLVRSESNHALTRAGCFMGTVDFVAPEQISNPALAAAASDIYSFGCTLIFLLSGSVPYSDGRYPSLAAKIQGHLQDSPVWFESGAREKPSWLVSLIQAMVAKNSNDRPNNCRVIGQCLQHRSFSSSEYLTPKIPLTEEDQSIQSGISVGQKLVLGSGLALAVTAGCWVLSRAGNNAASNDSATIVQTPTVESQMSEAQTNNRSGRSPATKGSTGKTLPVTTTHNAGAIRMPSPPLDNSSTSSHAAISKDKGHE